MRTLEQIRLEAKKTRAEAAAALGLGQSAYWRKEHGLRRLTAGEAAKLAQLFEAPVSDIVLAASMCADSAQSPEDKPPDAD